MAKATTKTSTKKVGHATLGIVTSSRSVKARIYYDGGPYKDLTVEERILKTLSARTEKDVLAKAKAWLDKQTAEKILSWCCIRCRDGQAMNTSTKRGIFQIHCDACGAVIYRGRPPDRK
ncbi:hypothetical protein ACFL6C_08315 [Myxococcota bacterium]